MASLIINDTGCNHYPCMGSKLQFLLPQYYWICKWGVWSDLHGLLICISIYKDRYTPKYERNMETQIKPRKTWNQYVTVIIQILKHYLGKVLPKMPKLKRKWPVQDQMTCGKNKTRTVCHMEEEEPFQADSISQTTITQEEQCQVLEGAGVCFFLINCMISGKSLTVSIFKRLISKWS